MHDGFQAESNNTSAVLAAGMWVFPAPLELGKLIKDDFVKDTPNTELLTVL